VDIVALLKDRTTTDRWVLDPAASRVEFYVKHLWGLVTVKGRFGQIDGEGSVGADGAITGCLNIDAASIDTKNKKRDMHLRSADFFNVEHHPTVVVTITTASPTEHATLQCHGTLAAAGHVQPIAFSADIQDGSELAVTLCADVIVDRTQFSMTWSPLGMASSAAKATVSARFVRR
jgi:polyisoprenoid-binding protein YceI